MGKSNYVNDLVKTPLFVLDHPHLLTPQEHEVEPGEPARAPSYGCVAIFDKETAEKELGALKELANKAKVAFFGPGKIKGLRSPFRKCEDKWEENDAGETIPKPGYPGGGIFISLNGFQDKPDCRDNQLIPIINAKVLYRGCRCFAVVGAYGYDRRGNKGVNFSLKGLLQKWEEGENIGGRVRAEDYFTKAKHLAGDSTQGGTTADEFGEEPEDDDIPF